MDFYYRRLQQQGSPSLLSRLFFTRINKILFSGKPTLEIDEMIPLADSEKISNQKLTQNMEHHSLFFAIIKTNWRIMCFLIFLETFSVIYQFLPVIFMQLLMDYLGNSEKPLSYGLIIALLFSLVHLTNPILYGQRIMYNHYLDLRVRNSLFDIIYTKMMNAESLSEGIGINLFQIDAEKIRHFFSYSFFIMFIPIRIFISIYLIYYQLGYSVFLGVAVIIFMIATNSILGPIFRRNNEKLMSYRDERIETSTQLFSEIKIIKAYNWQNYFQGKIEAIRQAELSQIRVIRIFSTFNDFLSWITPHLVLAAILGYYSIFLDQQIDAKKIFVTKLLLGDLIDPFMHLKGLYFFIIEVQVSYRRILKVINLKNWSKLPNSGHISLKNCTFAYEDKEVLKDISVDIAKGEFTAVIGPTGSGKSSFIQGLIGEMRLKSGSLHMNTNAAYTPSLDAWLLNGSIRENILMNSEFKEDWYWKVIDACCLTLDIQSFPAGDKTEIGEKGINLSGGQKARINLARAVYSDREVILLDDPLSSVDSRVADHIFYKCFKDLLNNKTRLLVTHNLKYLNQVDKIIEIDKGRIVNISARLDTKFNKYAADSTVNTKDLEEKNQNADTKNKIIVEEERELGQVNREVYKNYIHLAGGYFVLFIAVLSLGTSKGLEIYSDIVLKDWASDSGESMYYVVMYSLLRLLSFLFILLTFIMFGLVISLNAASKSHETLLNALISAPINLFYDVTPSGRILNRLTKDIMTIDESIAWNWKDCIGNIFVYIACLCIGILYFPYITVLLPIIFYPASIIGRAYIKGSREIKRLESISQSPMINHFKETLSGVKFIRVFDKMNEFTDKNNRIVDTNTMAVLSSFSCEEWFNLYMGLSTSFLLIALYFLAVVFRDSVSVGVAGLCISYLFPIPGTTNQVIKNLAGLENSMVSVERVKSYTEIPPEKSFSTDQDIKSPNWPRIPTIRFNNVYMKYRPNTELILKGISFEVPSGSRLGIAGRTGSGKSSMFVSLLRIVELHGGSIVIDGIDIAKLGLKKLRENITLIPQDPLVFKGTIKENLDPFGRVHKKVLEKAIDDVNLQIGLDHQLNNSGKNISVGERQLLGLCRALLSKNKIILFDEATAGIDNNTDLKIQKIIKSRFIGCTILTIAHRLETIKKCDLLLLMDKGNILEFETSEKLLSYDSKLKLLSQMVK